MKKQTKTKILISSLLFMIILSLSLISCELIKPSDTNVTSDGSITESGENIDQPTEAPTFYDIDLTGYHAVYPQYGTKFVSAGAGSIYTAMLEANVKDVTVKDDFVREGSGYFEEVEKEILVGNTQRNESSVDTPELGILDYYITYIDGKIVILGGSDFAVRNGANAFASLIGNDGHVHIPLDGIHYINDVNSEYSDDFKELLADYSNPDGSPMALAHRGDYSLYPENSLEAIQYTIDCGVQIVEIDVRKTKDGHWILMHDATVDRTTNGSGSVKTLTIDEIRQLYLKSGTGGSTQVTKFRVAELTDVLLLTRGKIMINLDKEAFECKDEVFELLIEYNCFDSVMFKSSAPAVHIENWFKECTDSGKPKPLFSCMLYTADLNYAITYLKSMKGITSMVELGFTGASEQLADVIDCAHENGIRAMVLTLKSELDKEEIWKQHLQTGYSVIMTNNSPGLMNFIEQYTK